MRTKEELNALNDGIYLFIAHDEYLQIDRISNSYIKDMDVSPGDAWKRSAKNPDQERDNKAKSPEQQKTFDLGTAYHVGLLEREELEVRFARKPSQDDKKYYNQTLLRNGTEIGNALAALKQTKKKSGETVMDQAQRLMELGFQGYIWAMEVDAFEQSLQGRIPIDGKYYDDLMRDINRIHKLPEMDQFLKGGVSEVTILFTAEDGTKRKARMDKLHHDKIVDLKSFDNNRQKQVEQCVHDAVQYNRYYIQAVFYWDAAKAIIRQGLDIMDSRLEGAREFDIVRTKTAEHVVQQIKDNDCYLDFWFIFKQKSGVPNCLARQFEFMRCDDALFGDGMVDPIQRKKISAEKGFFSALCAKGQSAIERAIKEHNRYDEIYSDGEPWQYLNAVGKLDESKFSPYWLGE